MTNTISLVQRFEKKVDCNIGRFCRKHPCFSFVAALIGMPAAILSILFVAVEIIVVPISALLG